MSEAPAPRVLIVGGGAAGRAAAEGLPSARLVARPETTAWHVEPGTLWTWRGETVSPLAYDVLVLAALVPQLALSLGCTMQGWQPVVDAAGRTSVPGVFAIGALIGARSAAEAERQGGVVAQVILGHPPGGEIVATPPPEPERADVLCPCLGVMQADVAASGLTDPAAIADLFGLRAGACRMARCGPRLGAAITLFPAAPVPLAALAARACAPPAPRARQFDPRLGKAAP
jgi:pyruvate/2-oxoglutarate dehydrogenase complex dihydrolipoamide dehydrogenase (E3) component